MVIITKHKTTIAVETITKNWYNISNKRIIAQVTVVQQDRRKMLIFFFVTSVRYAVFVWIARYRSTLIAVRVANEIPPRQYPILNDVPKHIHNTFGQCTMAATENITMKGCTNAPIQKSVNARLQSRSLDGV